MGLGHNVTSTQPEWNKTGLVHNRLTPFLPPRPPSQKTTHLLLVVRAEHEVCEDGRLPVLLVHVLPQPTAPGPLRWAMLGGEALALRHLLHTHAPCSPLVQQPTSFHTLKLIVQHEGAEAIGDVVVGQELEEVLVELKREWELVENLGSRDKETRRRCQFASNSRFSSHETNGVLHHPAVSSICHDCRI